MTGRTPVRAKPFTPRGTLMRRSARRGVLLLAAALALPGCYALEIDASGLQPHVYLTPETRGGAAEQVGRFEAETRAAWLFWGLADIREPDLDDILARELTRLQANGVTGLEIRTQQTFVDGLLQAITLGIYGRRTVFVEGIAVRRPEGGR